MTNEEESYILGFIAADGRYTSKYLQIHNINLELLEHIKGILGNGAIYKLKTCYRFEVMQNLLELGEIKDQKAYLRGYCDGKASMLIEDKGEGTLRLVTVVAGNRRDIIENIMNLLEIREDRLKSRGGRPRLKLYQKETLSLLNKLYVGATIGKLERLSFIEWVKRRNNNDMSNMQSGT